MVSANTAFGDSTGIVAQMLESSALAQSGLSSSYSAMSSFAALAAYRPSVLQQPLSFESSRSLVALGAAAISEHLMEVAPRPQLTLCIGG
jgi:hypothetical protein